MPETYVPKHMAPVAAAPENGAGRRRRMDVFDLLRGLALLSMIAFHTCYDLAYLARVPSMAWFAPPLEDVWRCTISWTFIGVAGCMCLLTRNNARRAAKYLAVALAVFVATTVAAADTPINFGVIFCMGACTLIYAGLERVGLAPRGYLAAVVCLALFLALLGIQHGSVWLFGANVELPAVLYSTRLFDWLGFPGPGFASGDYYPVLPHIFLFLAGAALMATWRDRPQGYPAALYARVPSGLRWICVVGRHTLWIYLAHQPVILGVLMLAGVL